MPAGMPLAISSVTFLRKWAMTRPCVAINLSLLPHNSSSMIGALLEAKELRFDICEIYLAQ